MKVSYPGNSARGTDALAVTSLLAAGVVIGWPIFAGGYLTYLDNPAHLAEIFAAAFEAQRGWSEIAFCGFPLSTLHSPVWYGLLGWLVRIGVPAGPPYVLCVWAGFVAPAVALYGVSRRTLAPLPALVLSYLLLIQRPVVVGVGSALGGMWTFFIASAALIVLVDRLSRPCESRRDYAVVAGLLGFTILTHLYTIVPLSLLAVVHARTVMSGRAGGRLALSRWSAAGISGIVAAVAYWVPMALSRDAFSIRPQNLDASMVLARLFVPTHVFELVSGKLPEFGLGFVVASLPMVVLVAAGGLGVFRLRRRENDAPLYGALMAGILLALLILVGIAFDVKFLGPGSWRMLYFVRLGLALSAIPLAAAIFRAGRPAGVHGRWSIAAVAVLAVTLGWWVGGPLRAVVAPTDGAEMAEVESVWEWLEENRTGEWGRVYLQDTFAMPGPDLKLSQSHVLALTSHRTGVRQLGASYGVAPYRTSFWTPSEFETLFRRRVQDQDRVRGVRKKMWATNSTHVVISDELTRQQMEASGIFETLCQKGRFTVFHLATIAGEWVSPMKDGATVRVSEFETGRYRFEVRASRPGVGLLVKSSYHPNWRLTAEPGVSLGWDTSGLMRLEGADAGVTEIEIEYRPPVWPTWVSVCGWVGILVVYATGRRRRSAAARNNAAG